jgi:nucleotide-binding universal stress UspA family protein
VCEIPALPGSPPLGETETNIALLPEGGPGRWSRCGAIGLGVLLALPALAVFGLAGGLIAGVLGYLLVQMAAGVAQAGQQALLPDLIATNRRGLAAGIKGFMDVIGATLGFVILGWLLGEGGTPSALLAIGAALKLIATEEAAATKYLKAIRQQLVARGEVTTTAVVAGQVVPEILSAVQPGDLLVMTTHGRTGLSRWLVGNVAEVVVRRSPVPVLVVRSIAVPAEAAEAYSARASSE